MASSGQPAWLAATAALLAVLLFVAISIDGTADSAREPAYVRYEAIKGIDAAVAREKAHGSNVVFLHCGPDENGTSVPEHSSMTCFTSDKPRELLCPDLPYLAAHGSPLPCDLSGASGATLVPTPDANGKLESFLWGRDAQGWYSRNCVGLLSAAVAYVPGVLFLQRAFDGRPIPDRLILGPLFGWNLFLSVFSATGAYKMIRYLAAAPAQIWEPCTLVQMHDDEIALWGYLFCASKLWEFMDTVFLCVRARKLLFLHVYHHVATFAYAWIGVWWPLGHTGIMMAVLNYCVHAPMYLYFALACTPVKPKNVVWITVMQCTQMVIGLLIALRCAPCASTHGQKWVLYTALAMYLSYLMLFSHFFYTRWIMPQRPKIGLSPSGAATAATTAGTKKHA